MLQNFHNMSFIKTSKELELELLKYKYILEGKEVIFIQVKIITNTISLVNIKLISKAGIYYFLRDFDPK